MIIEGIDPGRGEDRESGSTKKEIDHVQDHLDENAGKTKDDIGNDRHDDVPGVQTSQVVDIDEDP
jgi:hypothetical protein